MDEQFQLANNIMQKTSLANETVIQIREMKGKLKENEAKMSNSAMKKIITPFINKISAIEENLYQVKNQSGQDPLNFPIKLNNRLASLRRSIENGDAKPTDGAYKVFNELSAELEIELNNLDKILKKELPKVNKTLQDIGVNSIETSK